LGLLPGTLTPRLLETLVRLSTTQPSFAKASAELAWHTGTTVHADTARRRTETAGAILVAHETAEAERILREHPDAPPGPDTLIFSVDGAMVPIVGGQWKDVRTVAVGEVQPPMATPAGPVIQTTNLSYCSRLADSTTFAEQALPELQRRGIERAGRVGAVVDGAEQNGACRLQPTCQPALHYRANTSNEYPPRTRTARSGVIWKKILLGSFANFAFRLFPLSIPDGV